MDSQNLDQLLASYKHATDTWIASIRKEEGLATEDHSMVAMEKWDAAGLEIHDAEHAAKIAGDHYKSGLRKKNYGF